jgi:hypothetical protein
MNIWYFIVIAQSVGENRVSWTALVPERVGGAE